MNVFFKLANAYVLICIGLFILPVNAWTTEDLELFDLVEEINQNFYDLLGLDQSATTTEVKKAYRRLSLQLHPDKNKEEGAEEKFRHIVEVSDVLKDDARRKQYDEILQNGLPDWRMPIYYYRRVRKMGLWEMFVFLFLLLTVGQYIVAWSMYWEKKFEIEEILTSRFKPKKKKKGKLQDDDTQDIIKDTVSQIPKPSVFDLFPVTLTKLLITSSIYLAQNWREIFKKKVVEEEESSEDEVIEDRVRKPRKRVKAELPEYSEVLHVTSNGSHMNNGTHKHLEVIEEQNESSYSTEEWNEQATLALVKAMNKFPGGTINRWEKISAMIRRPVAEVTMKAKTLKSSSMATNVPTALQGLTGYDNFGNEKNDADENKNIKKKKVKLGIEKTVTLTQQAPVVKEPKPDDLIWSQPQQRALENALLKYPKGTDLRWEKIAEDIPGKTKEECMVRYKVLVEIIKKKKAGIDKT